MTVEPSLVGWVDALVAASAEVEPAQERSAVVEFTVGKKTSVAVEIVGGRFVGPAPAAEPAVSIPTTAAQLSSFVDGSASMARAYMQGDLKPVGSTGALLAVVSLFEDPVFREALAG
jgi:hypothetical protein